MKPKSQGLISLLLTSSLVSAQIQSATLITVPPITTTTAQISSSVNSQLTGSIYTTTILFHGPTTTQITRTTINRHATPIRPINSTKPTSDPCNSIYKLTYSYPKNNFSSSLANSTLAPVTLHTKNTTLLVSHCAQESPQLQPKSPAR